MTSVGAPSYILKSSDVLKSCLGEVGTRIHFAPKAVLFHEEDNNKGVYLIVKGKVCLSVRNISKLDRIFGSGSLLGLPSTFTARPYSLTATALNDTDVVYIAQEPFLQIMRERADLCREATEMLGREVSFIQSALAQRRKQAASKKSSEREPLAAL